MARRLPTHRVLVGVTGASGSVYAEWLLRALLTAGVRTYVIFTETAVKVIDTEIPDSFLAILARSRTVTRFEDNEAVSARALQVGIPVAALSELRVFSNDDLYAPVASGSEGATHMIVLPCSMGSLARIAHGVSSCLLERAADVILKERRTLVIVPRETPLSTIHLQNMLTLAQAGVHMIPAMPGFYQRPKTLDDVVAFVGERVLAALGIATLEELRRVRWNTRLL